MCSPLVSRALQLLGERGLTLATAESLTGGSLAALVTEVPGASQVFLGGVVSYASQVKIDVLGVSAQIIGEQGAVSAACAEAMARGVRERLGADVGLSTTGVAGPDTQEGHSVGTVFVALSTATLTVAHQFALSGDRDQIRRQTCEGVVHLLVEHLTKATS